MMSIFKFKNVWKFLVKIQLTKSDPKGQGVEIALLHTGAHPAYQESNGARSAYWEPNTLNATGAATGVEEQSVEHELPYGSHL